MKKRSLLNLAMALVMGQLLFACNSARYYEFAANKPEAYNQPKQKPAPAQEATLTLSEVAIAAAGKEAAAEEAAPVLEATTAPAPAVLPKTVARPAATEASKPVAAATAESITEAEAIAMAKERLATMTKAEKKELKKEMRAAFKQDSGTRTSIIEIILAIILPPLAVFLHDGIGTSFWISLLLTLLFFIPGVIYALLVVTDTI